MRIEFFTWKTAAWPNQTSLPPALPEGAYHSSPLLLSASNVASRPGGANHMRGWGLPRLRSEFRNGESGAGQRRFTGDPTRGLFWLRGRGARPDAALSLGSRTRDPD